MRFATTAYLLFALHLTQCCTFADESEASQERPVDFNRDIRPVLAAKCFACHGPDESHREADLRLDDREAALSSGAIVPSDPEESEALRRILSTDNDEVMPPVETGDALSRAEQSLFQRWIEQGAHYDQHWAFVPARRPALPDVLNLHPSNGKGDGEWPRNEIDSFVLARLRSNGQSPAPVADPYALVRRVYLDLIGLPPTPAQADAFVWDASPQAYEQLVDRLLASAHYGEYWARKWLDLARYADTNGYEKDRERSIWPYRDWVIRALNDDMPFDQFSIEQLAGDMLPHPTADQRTATGFHRNTMLNEEGGIDPLEFRFHAVVDRVATTGTVWLGLTTGCAQCHTHKYDPITHTDYYRLMALLNNADETDFVVKTPKIAARRNELSHQIDQRTARLPRQFPVDSAQGGSPGTKDTESVGDLRRRQESYESHYRAWLAEVRNQATDWRTLRPMSLWSNLPKLDLLDDDSIFSGGDATKRDVYRLTFDLPADRLPLTALRLEAMPDERLPAGGPGRAYYEGRKGDFFLSEIVVGFLADTKGEPRDRAIDAASPSGGGERSLDDVPLTEPSHSFGKIAVGSGTTDAANVLDGDGSTGWSTAEREGEPHQLVVNLAEPITVPGQLEVELLFERHFVAGLGRFRLSATSVPAPVVAKTFPVEIEAILAREPESWTSEESQRLATYYVTIAPELAEAREPINELRKALPSYPTTMVMHERPAGNTRPTHRHHRGEYLDPQERVTPGVPAFLASESGGPGDRLELARWLVSEKNPLIGRVVVNRAWQAFFGYGLVRSNGDFGTQSDPPTHPLLLDWLASELVRENWSIKRLHRRIVMSATYRQSSEIRADSSNVDPTNESLGRGPRHRLDAETIRDMMLTASGLLSSKMLGPSVRPPQPASVTAVAYGNSTWNADKGEDRYRRSIYTFSKRTAPFAAFSVFDAPSGEACVVRRNRSNTPLQALTLLNDEMYLEMARALAEFAESRERSDLKTATLLFRRLLTRQPDATELDRILDFKDRQVARMTAGELDPVEIMGNDLATPTLAAWAMTARALMNLDEVVTKP